MFLKKHTKLTSLNLVGLVEGKMYSSRLFNKFEISTEVFVPN